MLQAMSNEQLFAPWYSFAPMAATLAFVMPWQMPEQHIEEERRRGLWFSLGFLLAHDGGYFSWGRSGAQGGLRFFISHVASGHAIGRSLRQLESRCHRAVVTDVCHVRGGGEGATVRLSRWGHLPARCVS